MTTSSDLNGPEGSRFDRAQGLPIDNEGDVSNQVGHMPGHDVQRGSENLPSTHHEPAHGDVKEAPSSCHCYSEGSSTSTTTHTETVGRETLVEHFAGDSEALSENEVRGIQSLGSVVSIICANTEADEKDLANIQERAQTFSRVMATAKEQSDSPKLHKYVEVINDSIQATIDYKSRCIQYQKDIKEGNTPRDTEETLGSARFHLDLLIDEMQDAQFGLSFLDKPADYSSSPMGLAEKDLMSIIDHDPTAESLSPLKEKLEAFNKHLEQGVHYLSSQDRITIADRLDQFKSELKDDQLNELVDQTYEHFHKHLDPLSSLDGEIREDLLTAKEDFMSDIANCRSAPEYSPESVEEERTSACKMLEYAFGNSKLNGKLRDQTDKRVSEDLAGFFSRYSHVTKQMERYEEAAAKLDRIDEKLSHGETVRAEDKISPKEAHLISSFSKLAPGLKLMKEAGVATEKSDRILQLTTKFDEKLKEVAHEGWKDATIVTYHADEEIDYFGMKGGQQLETKVTAKATGGPEVHGAIVYSDDEGLRLSHVVGAYYNESLPLTAQSYAQGYKVDPLALLSKEGMEKASDVFGENWEKVVQEEWNAANKELQEEQRLKRATTDTDIITNSVPRRVKAALPGHKKLFGHDYTRDTELPEKDTQFCSEYAARSVVVTTNRFNERLVARLNEEIRNGNFKVKEFHGDERAATFPISRKEKMSRINPAYLIDKWGRESRKPKDDPMYHGVVFKKIEPGKYADYFHVPKK